MDSIVEVVTSKPSRRLPNEYPIKFFNYDHDGRWEVESGRRGGKNKLRFYAKYVGTGCFNRYQVNNGDIIKC
jgi:hypothetical protein